MRIVIDTNVFISGIFWEGNFCSQIINLWKNGKYTLITSEEILEEFRKVLKTFKIQMEAPLIEEWEEIIRYNAEIVIPKERLKIIIEDPDDNKFFEAAITGQAGYIISQNKHLLKIKEYKGIHVLTPKEFLEKVK